MNSELEKLIEKYRITVNGLADLESDYEKVIKERGFVTLNGQLADTGSPAGEGTGNTVNTENTPVAESDASHNEPVSPAPSEPVSNDTNLGNEVASGEGSNELNPSGERSTDENSSEDSEEESSSDDGTASTEEPASGGKPKKKRK